jgi:hypothetical protein
MLGFAAPLLRLPVARQRPLRRQQPAADPRRTRVLHRLAPRRRRRRLQQFVEQRAVMHECLPQVLGAGLPVQLAQRDRVRGAVVVHHHGVVHRQVRSLRLEVRHGIAAAHHDVAHQQVGLGHGRTRAVDEAALHALPFHAEALRLVRRQGHDLQQLVHAVLARTQFGLGLRAAARALHGALVFRPEALGQVRGAAAPGDGGDDDHGQQQEDRERDQQVHVHGLPRRRSLGPRLATACRRTPMIG